MFIYIYLYINHVWMGWGNAWCLCWGSLTTELHQTEPQGAEIDLTLMEKGVDE